MLGALSTAGYTDRALKAVRDYKQPAHKRMAQGLLEKDITVPVPRGEVLRVRDLRAAIFADPDLALDRNRDLVEFRRVEKQTSRRAPEFLRNLGAKLKQNAATEQGYTKSTAERLRAKHGYSCDWGCGYTPSSRSI